MTMMYDEKFVFPDLPQAPQRNHLKNSKRFDDLARVHGLSGGHSSYDEVKDVVCHICTTALKEKETFQC